MTDPQNTFEIVADEDGDAPEVGAGASIRPGDVLPEGADDAAAIDSFLSGFGRGFQVSIVRTAPVWCAGYLATLPMDHGITLSEIRESYGGRRFQLRILTDGGKYVTMRTVLISDVPRDEGRPIASLDKRTDDAKPNPAPPASPAGFGELAGVLRDLLASQQAASERQAAMIERLIAQPAAQVQAAIASPLEQIQQLGDIVAAVRELSPQIAPAAEGGGGEDVMLKLAGKLIEKWTDKKGDGAQRSPQLPPGRGAAPPAARRPPMIIRGGPRPPGVPPAPSTTPAAPAAITPNPTTIAAMHEARAMDAERGDEEHAAIAAEEPTPNPDALALEHDNDPTSSTGDDVLSSDEDGYTAEDVEEMLIEMPLDDAAEVIRNVFDRLDDAGKERAIAIVAGVALPESTSTVDKKTNGDP